MAHEHGKQAAYVGRDGAGVENCIVNRAWPEVDVFEVCLEWLVHASAVHIDALEHTMIILPRYQPLVDGEVELDVKDSAEVLKRYVGLGLPNLARNSPANVTSQGKR